MVPYIKDQGKPDEVPVPCGKCPECKGQRVSGWSFRLRQEEKRSESAIFATLTYNTKHVPIADSGYMQLSRRDLQLFFKRLRKEHSKTSSSKVKYYACGEYGGKTNRPHYHAIIYNATINEINAAWRDPKTKKEIGEVHFGDVTGASIGYVLKYMQKEPRIPMHRNDDRCPEFALMSKRLGDNYMTDRIKKWHKSDLPNRMYINLEDGKKATMPRYYKDKIYSDEERKVIAVQQKLEAEKKKCEKEVKGWEKYKEQWPKVKKELIDTKYQRMFAKSNKNRDKL